MRVPNRFRHWFCMEPDYAQQQDQWLLQERLRQIRRLEEENARLKWRNYNLDAQLTQTFDILDSQADLTRTFSGVPPALPMRNLPPARPGTTRDMLDELRSRQPSNRQRSAPSPKMSRRDHQGSLTRKTSTERQTSLELPMVQDFSLPSNDAISRAGSKGSLPAVKRSAFGFQNVQAAPRRRSEDAQRPTVAYEGSIPKFNDTTTDKANLTHD